MIYFNIFEYFKVCNLFYLYNDTTASLFLTNCILYFRLEDEIWDWNLLHPLEGEFEINFVIHQSWYILTHLPEIFKVEKMICFIFTIWGAAQLPHFFDKWHPLFRFHFRGWNHISFTSLFICFSRWFFVKVKWNLDQPTAKGWKKFNTRTCLFFFHFYGKGFVVLGTDDGVENDKLLNYVFFHNI